MAPNLNHYNRSEDLAWWKPTPQRTSISASSSIYSTPSEKALTLEQQVLNSAKTTSVYVSASNGVFSPDSESPSNASVVSAASARDSSTGRASSISFSQKYLGSRQKHESAWNSERWSQYSSASASSSLKERLKQKLPLRLLHRRSASNSSAQPEQQDITYDMRTSCKTNLSDAVFRDFGANIVKKMDVLEGKLDTLSSSSAFAPQPRRKERGIDVGVQVNLNNQNQQQSPKDKHNSCCNTLEEKVAHLSNTNTNLTSLNALLSSDLCRSQNTIHDLQNEVCLLREENLALKRRHGSYKEQRAQIKLQIDLIRRLGVLLGRREEQLESERQMMKLYREKIIAVEDEVDLLRTDWERLLPLVMPKENGPVLTTVEIDKNK